MDRRSFTILLSLLSLPMTFPLEFEENDYQGGLIFQNVSNARVTYDNFVVVYYTDLSPLFTLKTKISEISEQLGRFCPYLNGHCDVREMAIDRRMFMLTKNEENINSFEVGSQLHDNVTNVMAAIRYGREIENLSDDYSELIVGKFDHDGLLFLKQNNIIDKEVYEQLYAATDRLVADVGSKTYQVIRDMTQATRNTFIASLHEMSSNFLVEHEYASGLILDHLHSAMYGRFAHLFPINDFKTDLIEIETMLDDHQQLPINIQVDNPLNILKYSTIKASVYNKRLLIEVTIPKMVGERYTLYKIIPIPIRSKDFLSIIFPSTEHILIDQSSSNYIPIAQDELAMAPFNLKGEKMITPKSNIFHDPRNSCEITVKLNSHDENLKNLCNFRTIPITNYFIVLNSVNKYFFSISKPINLIEFCPNKQIFSKRITSPGFLTLTENCRIRTNKINLRFEAATTTKNHTELELFANLSSIAFDALQKRWNNIEHLISSSPSILIDNHLEDYEELADQIDALIQQISDQNTLDELYATKTKHNFYMVIGAILFLFIILFICAFCLHKQFCDQKISTALAGM